jgi:alkylation response protein AidB-like acyl-CoA dehydrogenase
MYDLTAEQEEVRLLARTIAEREFRPRALRWEETGEFPWENLAALARAGLLGAAIPEEYGGGGGSWLEASLILEEIGRCCYVTAMAALGELGVQSRAIAGYGSEEQKARFLPRIASGELICAICMTEPETGSDLPSMSTRAETSGDELVLNGRKVLISRADVAGLFLVYARFREPNGANGAGGSGEDSPVGAVLIERGTPGLEVGQRYDTLGGDGLFEVLLHDCRIPQGNALVRQDGLRRMLTAFNGQRCLNASISVGIAQGAQDAAIDYAGQREQGGRPIAGYQGIQWMLADNAMQIEAARLLVRRAAALAGTEFPSRYETAVAKTYANEMALRVTDSAMQIFGGHGWTRDMPIERYVRWARYGPLGGGTPQIQRNGIARELLRRAAPRA